MVSTLPYEFLFARVLISASLSIAGQASPDLLFDSRSKSEALHLSTRIDSLSTITQFFTRPVWGSLMDSYGRKPVLFLGCFLSFIARYIGSRFPKSGNAYLFYRVLNVNAVMPVMQASNALLIDVCGGRQSDVYIVTQRRMFMILAIARMLGTRFAANLAKNNTPPEIILRYAAQLILVGGLILGSQVKETLQEKSKFSVGTAWKNSILFFFKSKAHLLLALMLTLRSLPMFSGTSMQQLQRYDFKWGPAERALFTNILDGSEIIVPLILNEILKISPKKGQDALIWGSRLSAVALLNIALTPKPMSILLNPLIERLVNSQPYFDELLSRYRDGAGEGTLESAVSTLEFPIGIAAPPVYAWLGENFGSRSPYIFLALCALINSEVMSKILS